MTTNAKKIKKLMQKIIKNKAKISKLEIKNHNIKNEIGLLRLKK